MDSPEPPLVNEIPVDAAERSLVDDVRQLVTDGRTLVEAELAYHKSRLSLAGRTAKGMAGWIALALSLVFFALMALVMGLVIGLSALVGPWAATLVVVLLLLACAGFSGWAALRRWHAMEREMAESTPE